jgi:hypothetical protein
MGRLLVLCWSDQMAGGFLVSLASERQFSSDRPLRSVAPTRSNEPSTLRPNQKAPTNICDRADLLVGYLQRVRWGAGMFINSVLQSTPGQRSRASALRQEPEGRIALVIRGKEMTASTAEVAVSTFGPEPFVAAQAAL